MNKESSLNKLKKEKKNTKTLHYFPINQVYQDSSVLFSTYTQQRQLHTQIT